MAAVGGLAAATSVLEELAGAAPTPLPAGWAPPPRLAAMSCVYALLVGDAVYVGETDAIAQRLSQHRAKPGWAGAAGAVVGVAGGRSEARRVETLAIRALERQGVELVSGADGRHRGYVSANKEAN